VNFMPTISGDRGERDVKS